MKMPIHDILTHLHALKASSTGIYDLLAIFGLATALYLYVQVCLWASKPLVQYIGLDSSGKLVLRNDKRKLWDALQELKDLQERLDRESKARQEAEALALEGDAVARVRGRLGRVDTIDGQDGEVMLWLIVGDEYEDDYGDLQPGKPQAIRIRSPISRLWKLTDGCEIEAVCRFHRGRLTLDYFETITDSDGPLPEGVLPARYTQVLTGEKQRMTSLNDLDKDARRREWGSLNHCVYRVPIAWHLTTSPKYRRPVFDGIAAEVQAIVREVAEQEGLKVIALAAEPDHLHLLGIPEGPGGMRPTWCWSSWIGRFKALTSKKLKTLPGLSDFQWQVGYALTCVAGGKQSQEEALEVVKRYVEGQGDQTEPIEDREGVTDEV
jgi:REP element-mobilizing transposase RayT